MGYRVMPCSKEMNKLLLEPFGDGRGEPEGHGNARFPFAELDHGHSIAVPFDDAKESDVRSAASYHSRKREKLFRVIKHSHGLYEIGRIR